MNATERKKRSRIAERLGLVTAPRGYVTPHAREMITRWNMEASDHIDAEMKEPKK